MLYFSESAGELPGTPEEPTWDEDDYEERIARLIRCADRRAREAGRREYELWWAAVGRLKNVDDYIAVLIARAGLRPRGDLVKLLAVGIAIAALLLGAIFLAVLLKVDVPSREAPGFYLWAVVAAMAIIYVGLPLLLGKERFYQITNKLFERLFPSRAYIPGVCCALGFKTTSLRFL